MLKPRAKRLSRFTQQHWLTVCNEEPSRPSLVRSHSDSDLIKINHDNAAAILAQRSISMLNIHCSYTDMSFYPYPYHPPAFGGFPIYPSLDPRYFQPVPLWMQYPENDPSDGTGDEIDYEENVENNYDPTDDEDEEFNIQLPRVYESRRTLPNVGSVEDFVRIGFQRPEPAVYDADDECGAETDEERLRKFRAYPHRLMSTMEQRSNGQGIYAGPQPGPSRYFENVQPGRPPISGSPGQPWNSSQSWTHNSPLNNAYHGHYYQGGASTSAQAQAGPWDFQQAGPSNCSSPSPPFTLKPMPGYFRNTFETPGTGPPDPTVDLSPPGRDRPVMPYSMEVAASKGAKLMSSLDKRGVKLTTRAVDGLMSGDPAEYMELFVTLFNMDVQTNFDFLLHFVTRGYVDSIFEKMEQGALEVRVGCFYQLLNRVFKIKAAINPTQFMQHRFAVQKLDMMNGVVPMLSTRSQYPTPIPIPMPSSSYAQARNSRNPANNF